MSTARKLERVNARIERLRAELHRPDPVAEHFVHGRVGGSGSPGRLTRLNRQRAAQMDRTIDHSVELVGLIRERDHLRNQIVAEAKRPIRETALAEHARRAEEQIRAAGVGARVTCLYGEVKVARINRKTVTIETASGYREAIPYGAIGGVAEAPELTRPAGCVCEEREVSGHG